MVFSSAIFLFVFLPIVCALYFIVPGIRGKNTLLIIASLIFYAFGEPIYILLMIGSIIANYIFGLMEGRFSKANNIAGKKIVLIIAVICNIGVLCVFKYTAFILENINYAGRLNIKIPGIALPIGISFFTFQALSYVIDVYRNPEMVQKNLFNLMLYVSFFPQLIAGPTDLHECLGHGSGQLLSGVDPDSLKAYGNTIEEARADLFGLYYAADEKLVELGLLPDSEAYKAEYYSYMMNGLLTQLARIKKGNCIEEAHMRNRALIARWCYEKGHENNVVELVRQNGKTYVRINDYQQLRSLFADLLAEIQRIKSEGRKSWD